MLTAPQVKTKPSIRMNDGTFVAFPNVQVLAVSWHLHIFVMHIQREIKLFDDYMFLYCTKNQLTKMVCF